MGLYFEEIKFDFFIEAAICFVFCYRLNSFIIKISNLLLPFGGHALYCVLLFSEKILMKTRRHFC